MGHHVLSFLGTPAAETLPALPPERLSTMGQPTLETEEGPTPAEEDAHILKLAELHRPYDD
jgi:hypothetical protein